MKIRNRFLSVFLAMAMVLSGVTFAGPVFADDDTAVPNLSYTLTDYYTGNEVTTSNNGAKAKVLIFGRVSCP